MARPLRIEFAGGLYLITTWGNARLPIVTSDEDRELFLQVLGDVVDRFKWLCHAYVLMENHYHLVVETPMPNLSRGMRQLNGVYTQMFNSRHGRIGHLFHGRYKSFVVEPERLLDVCKFVVTNPVRVGMVSDPAYYLWSSYRSTAGMREKEPWLYTERILSSFGEQANPVEAYKAFVAKPAEPLRVRHQAFIGSDDFIAQMRSMIKGKKRRDAEIPVSQRHPGRRPLPELAKTCESRGEWMYKAYREEGYTMKEIADYAEVHYSTVSRIIKQYEKGL